MAQRSIVLPVALIVVGVCLLVWNLGWVPQEVRATLLRWWPLVLVGVGVFLLSRAATTPSARARAIVPGVILTIYGLFFVAIPLGLLRNDDVGRYWGVFPGAVGVALLARRWFGRDGGRSWLPAIVLLGVGVVGLVGGVASIDGRYWPLAFVAAGLLLLWRRRA